jgi:hypothetical protein
LWASRPGRIVVAVEVVITILGPTVGFGLFALLAMRYGAETRPGFDERPVKDDRPNWFAIPGSAPRPERPPPRRRGGEGHPASAPARRPAPRPAAALRPAASPVRAAAGARRGVRGPAAEST